MDEKTMTVSQLFSTEYYTVQEMIPESKAPQLISMIKSNIPQFIQYLHQNQAILQDSIDISMKKHIFDTQYSRSLSNLCLDFLSGDFGSVAELFIREPKNNEGAEEEMVEEKEGEVEELNLDEFLARFEILLYLLEYIRRPRHEISAICINYITKLLTHIIQNRPYHFYLFLIHEQKLIKQIYGPCQGEVQGESMVEGTQPKSSLDLLVELAYYFGSISEMLGRMISEEGETNKFIEVKERVMHGMMTNLLSEQNIRCNCENYEFLLDFVSYCFMRNKYRNEDGMEQITKVTQILVNQQTVSFFKEKLINSLAEIQIRSPVSSSSQIGAFHKNKSEERVRNAELAQSVHVLSRQDESLDDPLHYSQQLDLESSSSTSHHHKYSFNEHQLSEITGKKELEDLILSSEIIFHNAVSFLILLAERMNTDQQPDPYMQANNPNYKPQPTMDFQVNETLFSESSLLEIMTLRIPSKFSNLQRMRFYEFLLLLTKNSRFREASQMQQKGIKEESLVNILIHMLKSFNKQFEKKGKFSKKTKSPNTVKNSMVKFFIQQLMTQSILPKITKLEPKQAMMVLSAFNPSSDLFSSSIFEQDKSFIFKISVILQEKCPWFETHFKNLAVNIEKGKQQFTTKICGESMAVNGRKYVVKEFEFLKDYFKEEAEKKEEKKRGYSGQWSSSSNSDDVQFGMRRQFHFPDKEKEKEKEKAANIVQWASNDTENMESQDVPKEEMNESKQDSVQQA